MKMKNNAMKLNPEEQPVKKELSMDQMEAVTGGSLLDYLKKAAKDAWNEIMGGF